VHARHADVVKEAEVEEDWGIGRLACEIRANDRRDEHLGGELGHDDHARLPF
jgi:hypothetical protein